MLKSSDAPSISELFSHYFRVSNSFRLVPKFSSSSDFLAGAAASIGTSNKLAAADLVLFKP